MESDPLLSFGYDLTSLVQQELFPPLIEYDSCIAHIFHILLREKKNNSRYNPLLLDTDGSARWPIIFEIARRIASGNVPDQLAAQWMIALNYEALFTHLDADGARDPGMAPASPVTSKRVGNKAMEDRGDKKRLHALLTGSFSRVM